MWGGGDVDTLAKYTWDPDTIMAQVHMPWIAKNADDQVGRVMKALKDEGEWSSTLFVVLADHGSTCGEERPLRRRGRRRQPELVLRPEQQA